VAPSLVTVGTSVKVVVYKDASGDFRWKTVAENGEIVADSA